MRIESVLEFPLSKQVPSVHELFGGDALTDDVSGAEGQIPFRFWVGQGDERLWLAARAEKSAMVHPTVPKGAWHFGLWYFDCAELFLACSATGRYLEVNLAPNGAYWIGVFSGPRQLDENATPESWRVDHVGLVEEDVWRAQIAIPVADVVAALGGMPDRGNVTAVLDGCPDEDAPLVNLRSVAPIDSVAPDFHVPDRFVDLKFAKR